ncbi:DNA binding domain-containing protein, excisionase family [Dethiosulfatibacter aminovorans DSM 17477]|uniref:DNA binding domain-containing protein, excisionase family n=1 Tax=Dethiosulfatibacter aminovorans DSM 17477 TaxID=1121476 RepID=A0A1M6I466_9FIRM|nr:helix-turn-helix domain-containing protein [Dethiosulfatibacter aminovorans]SHJ29257.1 DNA binding domain-containing protein, excisionase family [Dethiosulfatibacter aminovorans DSM 17477]
MKETYYTVEAISKMLEMHPKTIQRYIREGKLKATKVGKAWRVSGHDLSVFMNDSNIQVEATERKSLADRISISSVIDIDVSNMEEAMKISSTLTAAMNSKSEEYGKTSLSVQFLDTENKLRIMVWGNAAFMEALMSFLSHYS